jgi:hypothetical protein
VLMLGLFVTGSLLILLGGWRASLLALLAQYVLLGLWLAKLYRPEALLLKTLIGVVVVAMIYLVAAEVRWGATRFPARNRAPSSEEAVSGDEQDVQSAPPVTWPTTLMGSGFRLATAVLAAVATYGLTINYPLPDVPPDVNLAFYWLCAAGLVCLMISRDVVNMGVAVLCIVSGLDLFYVAMVGVPDIVILGLLAGMNLVVALVIARAADATGTVVDAEEKSAPFPVPTGDDPRAGP